MKKENVTQLAVNDLSPAKRQQIERTKEWLLRLLAEAEAKQQQLESLTAALLDARSRRDQYDHEAATDEEAASKFAAAEIQIRKLAPQVEALESSLGKDLQTIALQIGTVRKEDISKNFGYGLAMQLHASLKKILQSLYEPKDLDAWADQWLPTTWAFRQLLAYDTRPAPIVTTVDKARQAINATVKELDVIISGEVLLEIIAPIDPPEIVRPPTPSAREAHNELLRRTMGWMKRDNNTNSAADYGQPISTDKNL